MFSFGTAAPAASQPASTPSFSFGTSTPAPAQPASSFSFGTSTPAAPAATATSSFSFGGTSSAPAAATTTSTPSFSFSSTPATQQPATTTSSFSFGTAAPAAAPSTSTFSFSTPAATAANTSNPFGGGSSFGLFGQQQQQLGQPAPAPAPVNWGPMRFADLPENYKKQLEEFETFRKQQKQIIVELGEKKQNEELSKIKQQVESLSQAASAALNWIERERKIVLDLKQEARRVIDHADTAARTVHAKSNPAAYAAPPMYLPSKYYWEMEASFRERMRLIRLQIEELERHVAASKAGGHAHSPHALKLIMKNQHELFVKVAAQVAQVHDRVQDLKEGYLRNMALAGTDAPNPFDAPLPSAVAKKPLYIGFGSSQPAALLPGANPPAATPAAPAASPFGAPTSSPFSLGGTSTTPAPTGSFFGLSTPSTPAPTTTTGGLFGTPAGSTTPSLFGGATGTASTPPATGGLFGSSTPAFGTPASTTGGLFGAASTPAFGTPAAGSPGLFGTATNAASATARRTTASKGKGTRR
eukprot:tig00000057_g64.t1